MSDSDFECLLFDLDGTLIDTAPDMAGALVTVCREESVEPPPYADMRATVANGGVGLLELAFGQIDDLDIERLLPVFLEAYGQRLADESRLFPGMPALLDAMDCAGKPWGIVTNKPQRLTIDLLQALDLHERPGCIIGGDSLAVRKPHPDPLLHAADQLAVDPGCCVYVGDNDRDMIAGRAAGMTTMAASWGYILPDDNILEWQADRIIDAPEELFEVVGLENVTQR